MQQTTGAPKAHAGLGNTEWELKRTIALTIVGYFLQDVAVVTKGVCDFV